VSEFEQIKCYECGDPVSSPVPKGTVIRAYVLCPECLEKIPDEIANQFFFSAGRRRLSLMVFGDTSKAKPYELGPEQPQ
jgi:hypothetical protein